MYRACTGFVSSNRYRSLIYEPFQACFCFRPLKVCAVKAQSDGPGLQAFVMGSSLIPAHVRQRKQQSCSQTCNKPLTCLKKSDCLLSQHIVVKKRLKVLFPADKSIISGLLWFSCVRRLDNYCCIYAVWATWNMGYKWLPFKSCLRKRVQNESTFLVVRFVLIHFWPLNLI